MTNKYSVIAVSAMFTALSACSSLSPEELLPDSDVAYKKSRQAAKNLEVPPDLTSRRMTDRMSVPELNGVATSYSEYTTDRKARGRDDVRASGGVLAELEDISVQRDGDVRWITVRSDADSVWDKLLGFWQEEGILLTQEDPDIGIMLTAWIENRANVSRDIISSTLRKVFDGLYESGLRDQYRVRIEKADNEQIEIFLTHYGMEEKLAASGAVNSGVAEVTWEIRPRDPELEIEMLKRMMVYMGVSEEKSKAKLAARNNRKARSQMLKTKQGVELRIDETFSRSWRLVGLALDRVGFAVYDRDRSAGTYYVRYNDPAADTGSEGFFSKLKFWGDSKPEEDTEYQIRIVAQGERSVAAVFNSEGERLVTGTAARILNLVNEQIR